MPLSESEKARYKRWYKKHEGKGKSREDQIAAFSQKVTSIDWSLLTGREAIVLKAWLDKLQWAEICELAGVVQTTAQKDLKKAIEKLKSARQ